SGRIVPARKFQAEVSMSVVANSEPLFQLCINCTVPDADRRKMAATMEPSGLCPSAPSSAAFSTQNAASRGESLATTMVVTKLLKLASTPDTQELEMFPPWPGMLMPCAANQDRNCGSVSRITDHSAHRW